MELPHHYFSDSNLPILQELWLVMIYCSHRLKCTVLLSFNYTIKYFGKTWPWRLRNYVESHWKLHCSQKDHYSNSHFSLLWEKLWKETLNCWSTVFLKTIFYPSLKLSLTAWNFFDFKDAHQCIFFCLSWAPVLSSHIYTINESPLKYLDTSFLHTHSSPLCVFGHDSCFVYNP